MRGSQEALTAGDIPKAKQLCDQALHLAEAFGPADTRPSRSLILLAEIYRAQDQLNLAEQSFKDAVASCQKAVGPDHPAMMMPVENLANFYYFVQKRYDQAAPLCEWMLRLAKIASPRNNADIVKRTRAVAAVYRAMGQFERAEPYYKQTLTLTEQNPEELPVNLLKVSDFYREWGKYEPAESLAKRALNLSENAAQSGTNTEAQENVAVSLYGLAEIYRSWGKADLAEPLYERSMAMVEQKEGKDSPELAHPLEGLAATLLNQGKTNESEMVYLRALAVTEDKMEPDAPVIKAVVREYAALLDAANRSAEANALRQTRQWKELMFNSKRTLKTNVAESERLCGEALKLAETFGPNDTRRSQSQVQMAEIYRWQGRNDLAEASFHDAVASCEKAVGPNHPDMIAPLESLANFYHYTKVQYDQVASLYQWILNIVQSSPTPDYVNVASWSRNLAEVYRQENQNALAETFYKQALAAIETATNSPESDQVQYLQDLADSYRAWNKCDEAEPLAKRALAIREKAAAADAGPDAQLDIAVSCDSLGQLYLAWNKPDQAELFYNRSLGIVDKIAGADSPDLTPRLMGLAAALHAQKKNEAAIVQYQRALAIAEKTAGSGAPQPDVVGILEKYAAVLQDLNRSDEAKSLLARAEAIRKSN